MNDGAGSDAELEQQIRQSSYTKPFLEYFDGEVVLDAVNVEVVEVACSGETVLTVPFSGGRSGVKRTLNVTVYNGEVVDALVVERGVGEELWDARRYVVEDGGVVERVNDGWESWDEP